MEDGLAYDDERMNDLILIVANQLFSTARAVDEASRHVRMVDSTT